MIGRNKVLLASFASLFMISGVQQSFSIFFEELHVTFAWSSAQISLAMSISLVVSSASIIAFGRLIDKYGARVWMILGVTVAGTSMLLLGFIQELWQLYVLYGVFIGLISSSCGLVASTTIVGKWFERSGPAFGILQSGLPLGSMAIVAISAWIVFAFDWRYACFVIGPLVLLVLPILLAWAREPPKAVFGASGSAIDQERKIAPATSLLSVLGDRKYQTILLIQLLCGLTDVPVVTHWVPIGLLRGIEKSFVANALVATSFLMFVGTLVFGYLSDGYGGKKLLIMIYGIRTLSFVFLLMGSGVVAYLVFVVLFGITIFAMVPIFSSIVLKMFGEGMLARTYSVNQMVHLISAALGILALGLIRDYTGVYTLAIIALMLVSFVAMLLVCIGKFEGRTSNNLSA